MHTMAVLKENPVALPESIYTNADSCVVSPSNVKKEYITDPVPQLPKLESGISLVKNESNESPSTGDISEVSPSRPNETHEVVTETAQVKQEATSPPSINSNSEHSSFEEQWNISVKVEEAQEVDSQGISSQQSEAIVEGDKPPFRVVNEEPTKEDEASEEHNFALPSSLTAREVLNKNQNEFSHFLTVHHDHDTIKLKDFGILEEPASDKLNLQLTPTKTCPNEKFSKQLEQDVSNDVGQNSADCTLSNLLKFDWDEVTEENEQNLGQAGFRSENQAAYLAENKDGLESLPRVSGNTCSLGSTVGNCSNMNKCSLDSQSEISLNTEGCLSESLRSSSCSVNMHHSENQVSISSGIFEHGFGNHARISSKVNEVGVEEEAWKDVISNEFSLKNQGEISLIKEEPGVENEAEIIWIKNEPSFESLTETVSSMNEESFENGAESSRNQNESSSGIQIGTSWSLNECSFEDETRTCSEPRLYSGYSSEDSDTSSPVHQTLCKRKKLFTCHKCKQAFFDENALKQHAILHRDERRYICEHCAEAFEEKKLVIWHLREVHPDAKYVSCKWCPASFKTVSNLNRHVARFHSSQRLFSCSWCSMAFYEPRDLRRHAKTHSGQRRYVCGVCSLAFKSEMDLITHSKQVHSIIKPFACDLCHKSFRRVASINYHVNVNHAKEMHLITDS